MNERRRRRSRRPVHEPPLPERLVPLRDERRVEHEAEFQHAGQLFTDVVLPGVAAFQSFMADQHRQVRVTAYADHIEGPQIVVQITRPDGRITATLMLAVTATGVRPTWDVQSTGRVTTHWTEPVPGGAAALTPDQVLAKLQELATTDFS